MFPSVHLSSDYSLPPLRLKSTLTILNQKLHRRIFRLRILHLPRQTLRPHNSRCKNDCNIRTRHQVLHLLLDHPRKMED